MLDKTGFGKIGPRLAASLLLCLLAPALLAAPGLCWRIAGAAAEPSYILGTMHSEDPRIVNLPAGVERLFRAARSFTDEVDMNEASLLQVSQRMFYADDTTLSSRIDARLYKAAVALLADYGIPEMLARKMKPWAVATTLSMPRSGSGLFLDRVLFLRAQEAGKQVHALETVEEQLAVFERMPADLQIRMLEDAVYEYERAQTLLEKLRARYLQRDLDGIRRLSEAYMKQGDAGLAAYFRETVIEARNRRMLERMQPRLKEGNAFIAVGALHLPGRNGLLRLLEAQGFKLTPVY